MSKEDDKTKSVDVQGDDPKVEDDPTVEGSEEDSKTYTQSELDKEVDRRLKQAQLKVESQKKLSTELEELRKWKDEKENAEMTEIQKKDKEASDLKKKLEDLERDNKKKELQILKNRVLSDKKYSILTRAYKNIVEGDTEEELILSADQALKEYTDDLRLQGVNVKTPPPDLGKEDKDINTTPKTPSEKAKAVRERKIQERLNQL
jgi:hypothetical protein